MPIFTTNIVSGRIVTCRAAIHRTCVRAWRTKPRYVLFAGEASYDQKGYVSDTDHLQTRLVDTLSMETASDEWFGDLNNDSVAEMAIGRLPSPTAESTECNGCQDHRLRTAIAVKFSCIRCGPIGWL
ncbi:MAG: hypothetical protein IPG67_05985 [Acidobacteria bacterium]|nr:hypothetical protein [Acidobacteriota bacterium]